MSVLPQGVLAQQRIARAAAVNPIKELLATQKRPNAPAQDAVSVATGVLAGVGAAAAGFALYYVLKNTPKFREVGGSGVRTLAASATLAAVDLNVHYVVFPPPAGATFTLPAPGDALNYGTYASVYVPEGEAAAGATVTSPTLTASKTVFAGSGALFMVANHIGVRKWKLVREW